MTWETKHIEKIRQNLRQSIIELKEWRSTGILVDGVVRDVACGIKQDIDIQYHNCLNLTEKFVNDCAFDFVLLHADRY